VQQEGEELGLGYPGKGERDRNPEAVMGEAEEEEVPVPRAPAPVAARELGRLERSCQFRPWLRQLVAVERVPVWALVL
jgi:hypothetical protein